MRTNWQSGPKHGSRAPLASAKCAKTQKGVDRQWRATHVAPPFVAGWSSLVARQAHNLKVAGSNPAPAPNLKPLETSGGFFFTVCYESLMSFIRGCFKDAACGNKRVPLGPEAEQKR